MLNCFARKPRKATPCQSRISQSSENCLPSFWPGLLAALPVARVAACSGLTFAVCSRTCRAKTSKQSRCTNRLLLEPFSGSSNRSFGMKKKCEIGVKESLPRNTVIPKQSAASTRPGRPRAVNIPPVSNASTAAIVAKSRTALTVSHWPIPLLDSIVCWMLGCTFP